MDDVEELPVADGEARVFDEGVVESEPEKGIGKNGGIFAFVVLVARIVYELIRE